MGQIALDIHRRPVGREGTNMAGANPQIFTIHITYTIVRDGGRSVPGVPSRGLRRLGRRL